MGMILPVSPCGERNEEDSVCQGLSTQPGRCGTQATVAVLLEMAPTAHSPGMVLAFKSFQKATEKCRTTVSSRMGSRRAADLMCVCVVFLGGG